MKEIIMTASSTKGPRSGWTRRGLAARAALSAATLSAGALAACGGAESGATGQSAKTAAPYTLVWGLRTSAKPEQLDAALSEFKAQRPHVTVDRFDAAGSGGIVGQVEKLTAALAGGVAIDVVMGSLTGHM